MHCMLMDLLHGFEVLSTTEETLFNRRRIVVWNMEDAPNEMEDLKNGMEGPLPYFRTKYKHSRLYIKTYNKLRRITKLKKE